MASRRRRPEQDPRAGVLAQQDEADVVAEVGAELDENGEFMANEEDVLKVGAIDSESVIENRRSREATNKRRGGVKGVSFNAGDILSKYEYTIKSWPPNTLDIYVKRLTGAPVECTITSRPRSGVEFYEALKAVHGQHEEAKYSIKFLDNSDREFRGQGHITMPDTRPPSQQGQPMNPPYYPPQPGYAQPPPGYAPQPQPAVQVMPQAFDPNSMVSMMGQMFKMFQQMQASAQPAPLPQPPAPTPQMPPLSPQAGPAEMAAWMQQAFQLFQQAQTPPPSPFQPAAPPAPMQQVPVAQPNLVEMLSTMEAMFKMFQRMQGPGGGPGPGPGSGPGPGAGPYRGPYRPPYYPQGDQQGAPPHAPPPQRQQTPAEHFREAIGIVRTAVDAVQEINTLLPGQGQQDVPTAAEEDDDNPIKIIATGVGKMKLAVNKGDGALRWAETGMMALPDVLKWIGEQREQIQKASNERQRQQQQPTQQLPPGYVEVGPGYQPPPGFIAVPVDPQTPPGYVAVPVDPQHAETLPPPPAHMPPPISPPPQVRRTWGAPEIPEGEN